MGVPLKLPLSLLHCVVISSHEKQIMWRHVKVVELGSWELILSKDWMDLWHSGTWHIGRPSWHRVKRFVVGGLVIQATCTGYPPPRWSLLFIFRFMCWSSQIQRNIVLCYATPHPPLRHHMRANVLNLWIFETLDQSRTFENVLELPGTSGTINYNQEVLVWEACNLLWLSLLWDQCQCSLDVWKVAKKSFLCVEWHQYRSWWILPPMQLIEIFQKNCLLVDECQCGSLSLSSATTRVPVTRVASIVDSSAHQCTALNAIHNITPPHRCNVRTGSSSHLPLPPLCCLQSPSSSPLSPSTVSMSTTRQQGAVLQFYRMLRRW